MSEQRQTREQLQHDLAELQRRVIDLEAVEAARQRAEAALRESELKYRKMFEASTDAIFLETLEGQVLDCNDSACAMFGYSREEFLQLSAADLVPLELAEQLRDGLSQVLATGSVFFKTANRRKNGQIFPVEVSAQVISIEGEPRVITYVRDITEREQAAELLNHRMQELIAIYETTLEINAQRDLSKLLPGIVERAARLIGAPMGGLYLLQPGGETLKLVVSYNLPGNYIGAILRMGEGLSGRVAQTGETIVIDDYQAWEGRAQIFASSPFRRVLGVPLMIESGVIGVINVTDTEEKGPYSEQEIQLINLLANQAAIAIRNTQLLEALQSELAERKRTEKVQAALYRISEATQTAEDLSELFRLIHATIEELMPARNFYIALYDASADLLSFPYYADEYDAPPPPSRPLKGLTEYVLQTGQPLLATPEVYEELLASGQIESIGAPSVDWLGVPLKIQKNIIGMMAVQSYTHQDRYSQADQDVLAFVSTQAAMAIERKQAEEALRHSEERYRLLFENAPIGILLVTSQGLILDVNPTALDILGSPSAKATKTINILTFPPLIEAGFSPNVQKCLETGQAIFADCPYISKWGKSIHVQYYLSPILDADGRVILVQIILEDITERKRAEGEIQRHAEQLSLLYDAGITLNRTFDSREQLKSLSQIAMQALHADHSGFFRYDPPREEIYYEFGIGRGADLVYLRDLHFRLGEEHGLIGWIAQNRSPFYLSDVTVDPRWIPTDPEIRSAYWVPIEHENRLLGLLSVVSTRVDAFSPDDQRLLGLFANQVAVALDKLWLFEAERDQREFAETLSQFGTTLSSTLDAEVMLDLLLDQVSRAIPNDASDIMLIEANNVRLVRWRGYERFGSEGIAAKFVVPLSSSAIFSRILQTGEPLVIPDIDANPDWVRYPGLEWQHSNVIAPIRAREIVIGFLNVYSVTPGLWQSIHGERLRAFADQAAVALENARLYRSAVDATERSTALHWLSQEIVSASLEPERIYNAIYQAAQKLMPAEAFIIAMLDEKTEEIEMTFCIDQGERFAGRHITRQQGLSGYVIGAQKSLIIRDVEHEGEEIGLVHFGTPSSVRSILAVPMRLGERVLGMLSAQSYHLDAYSGEDASLLEILAASAAIALENARIFSQMQAANIELANAYEATIEGWSRALEMRDKETKGHSERVTRLTLRLAREVGLSEQAMIHLRRGVLLHDIGKMAVPDHILLKPSSLSEDEWQIMRQHPLYAHQMLSGIPFLEPALDIPYCHHENWGGSGYPRGLKGEEIPIGARIFAIVDVWDALTSDRPYRLAWVQKAVNSYILQQSGLRFDPQLVTLFLKLLDAGEFEEDVG